MEERQCFLENEGAVVGGQCSTGLLKRGEGVFCAFGAGKGRRAAAIQEEQELQSLHLAVQPVFGIQRSVVFGCGESIP